MPARMRRSAASRQRGSSVRRWSSGEDLRHQRSAGRRRAVMGRARAHDEAIPRIARGQIEAAVLGAEQVLRRLGPSRRGGRDTPARPSPRTGSARRAPWRRNRRACRRRRGGPRARRERAAPRRRAGSRRRRRRPRAAASRNSGASKTAAPRASAAIVSPFQSARILSSRAGLTRFSRSAKRRARRCAEPRLGRRVARRRHAPQHVAALPIAAGLARRRRPRTPPRRRPGPQSISPALQT